MNTESNADKPEWPPTDLNVRKKFVHAFEEALNRSIQDQTVRDALEESPEQAKNTIQAMLKELYPEETAIFPKKVVVAFYAPALPPLPGGGELKSMDTRPSPVFPKSAYVHVFHLPPYTGQPPAKRVEYAAHLRCCYDPWIV